MDQFLKEGGWLCFYPEGHWATDRGSHKHASNANGIFTIWKVDGATPMYEFIMSPVLVTSPPFGSGNRHLLSVWCNYWCRLGVQVYTCLGATSTDLISDPFGCSELRPWSWPKTSSWTLLVAWLGDGSHDMSVNLGQANVTKLPMSCFPSATAAWSAPGRKEFFSDPGSNLPQAPPKKGKATLKQFTKQNPRTFWWCFFGFF